VGTTRFFAARASSACGRSASGVFVPEGAPLFGIHTHAGFLPRPDPPRLSAGRASRTTADSDVPCRTERPPASFPFSPPRALSQLCSSRVATARARTTPLACRLRPRISRSRTPSIGSIPTSSAGNGHSDEQLAPNFQATQTPFRDRQQPGPSRLVGRRSSLLPVVTRGTVSSVVGLRREGTSHQSLQPTSCQSNGYPVKPPVFGTDSGLRRADHRFRALPLDPHCKVRALEQHRRR
jgi:hypothetical protein